jgi:hypothetical protein
MVVAPTVALIGLGDDPGGAPFALTVAGPLLVSYRLSEPNYDVMLAWDPDRMPAGWEATRGRYFALNWIRAVAVWTAFGLFLAALVESL